MGDVVTMNVSGTDREFIVVHQGLPSSIYDDSCDGTWLLMKDLYEARTWHSSNVNDYENSTIHSYLNSTFLGYLDSNIQSAVKQVKIPYRKGSGYSTTVTSGSSGLSAKIFLLSAIEVGCGGSSYAPADGALLSYFTAETGSDTKRVAYLNGGVNMWWLRSPWCNSDDGSARAWYVGTSGKGSGHYCSNLYCIRPALVLPKTALVDGNYNVIG